MLASLVAFVLLTGLTAGARSVSELVVIRLLTGLGASGVVPLGLALIGQVYPYERRGRPLGWLFGAMAGGAAFGATLGVLLEPWLGWHWIFILVSALGAVMFGLLLPYRGLLGEATPTPTTTVLDVMRGYRALLTTGRGQRTYAYVLLNAIFHSGVFSGWGLLTALWSRRGRHRPGVARVWCARLRPRAHHRASCRPMGPAMAPPSGVRNRCARCGVFHLGEV